jgi:hypothetical protein
MRAAVLLLAMIVPAFSADRSIDFRPVTTCADVRQVVAIHGQQETERQARAAGASEARIAWAKRCLKS